MAAADLANDEQPWEVEADDSPPAPRVQCVILEAGCDSRERARNAVRGGALRLDDLRARHRYMCGGLTPSPQARPRLRWQRRGRRGPWCAFGPGTVVYTEEELRDMVAEVQALGSVGCRGPSRTAGPTCSRTEGRDVRAHRGRGQGRRHLLPPRVGHEAALRRRAQPSTAGALEPPRLRARPVVGRRGDGVAAERAHAWALQPGLWRRRRIADARRRGWCSEANAPHIT